MELKNKTILITGASRGIGKAIALEFASKEARVVVCYNNNKEMAELVAKECGHKSFALDLDVSDNESIINAIKYLEEKEVEIDVLVNNAGVICWKPFLEQTIEELENQVNTNYLGLLKNTSLFLPKLKEKKEAIIINISSIAAKYAPEELAPYSGTKSAVVCFTKALAKELPKNIKVYSISPGLTSTDMTNHEGVPPEKVSSVVIKVVEGEIKLESGEDLDVRAYY